MSVGAVCASVLALDLANSGADGDSPIDSTDSDLDAPAHKHMDRDADSDAARKARLSDS